jgi:Gti1/Pac2 family transcription factor
MQRPTCTNTRIRSTADAHSLFYAVKLGMLPLIRRRPDAEERLALRSGDVYIWEERSRDSETSSMGRFTEGKRWSESRTREVRLPKPRRPLRSASLMADSGARHCTP